MSPLDPQYPSKKRSVVRKITAFVEKFKEFGGGNLKRLVRGLGIVFHFNLIRVEIGAKNDPIDVERTSRWTTAPSRRWHGI
ncbi:hypothetical protein [Herbaspirillum rubrisubalbicans]|nr:hypothetical protein [Herbaspirillum rubrisubalbicans]